MDTNETLTVEEVAMGVLHKFDWYEYLVFASVLALSVAIGIYFGIYKTQKTVTDYLLGGKKMTVFPIAMSLVSSYTSGITLLGLPAEIYFFGSQFALSLVCNLLVCIITVVVFLPTFYKLQLLSLYEYLEMRFNHSVRIVASVLFAISLMLYIPLVIYGPALALNQVSGMSIHWVTPVLCIVCIFYTTLGGLKAVVWTDAVQGVLMIIAVYVILTMGIIKAGGVGAIWDAAKAGERLNVFDMNPDPLERLTFWQATLGFTVTYVSYVAVNPACIQRFISLPNYRHAQLSVFFLAIGINIFSAPSFLLGLIMYAVYQGCDPLRSGAIKKEDQILPYFVLDVAGHIKGLPGLFIVGVCCAALSTMSTGLNTVAGTIYEDFIEPLMKVKLSEEKASRIIKCLVLAAGAICVLLVYLVEKLGPIVELSSSFGGMTGGSSLGIFILGMLCPRANTKGALTGGVVSLVIMVWIMVGRQVNKALIVFPRKPVSVAGCVGNITQIFQATNATVESHLDVFPLYRLSPFYYSITGCLIVVTVGLAVSYMTEPPENVNPDLFSPVIQRFLPKDKKYQQVPLKQTNGPTLKDSSKEESIR